MSQVLPGLDARILIFILGIFIAILTFFMRKYFDRIETTMARNTARLDDLTERHSQVLLKISDMNGDMRDRFHEMKNDVNEAKGELHRELLKLEATMETAQRQIEDRHHDNKSIALQYKEDIVKTNQGINSIVRGNMEIMTKLGAESEKVIRLEDYVKGLKTRLETLERNIIGKNRDL